MPRHGSVEDFLSLVACGDIPAPESNILSNSIFSGTANQQRNAAAAQAARVASAAATAANASAGAGASGTYSNFPPPAVISFSGTNLDPYWACSTSGQAQVHRRLMYMRDLVVV